MKNKFLITIDGIRKDRIGVYNYKAEWLTPNLTAIGRDSVVFDDMFASATSTGMCFSSIFTGRNQREFGRKKFGDTINPFVDNIFSDHEKVGYKTIVCLNRRFGVHHKLINAFSNAEHWWTGDSSNNRDKNIGSLRPLEQVNYLIDKLEHVDKPVFVWMHLWGFSAPVDRFARKINFDYDARVAELDEAIGVIFNKFKKNSIMCFFSDHGYSFFEHGKWSYGKDATNFGESVTSIPFIIYDGVNKGVNDNLVSQLRVRRIVERPDDAVNVSDDIAYCESRYSEQSDISIAIRKGKLKLIYEYYDSSSYFYDLVTDPCENINIASNAFYKLTRDSGGAHMEAPPYIIRSDWDELQAMYNKMLSIAHDYYGDCRYTLIMKIKEWFRRLKGGCFKWAPRKTSRHSLT